MSSQQLVKDIIAHYQLNPALSYVGIVDGDKSKDLKAFMKETANAFQFPDYYSGNMNSFMEIINDLSWLNANDYVLAITESSKFLKDESVSEQDYIKQRLADVSKEWSGVPNYQGEDEYRKKSRFIVHYM